MSEEPYEDSVRLFEDECYLNEVDPTYSRFTLWEDADFDPRLWLSWKAEDRRDRDSDRYFGG